MKSNLSGTEIPYMKDSISDYIVAPWCDISSREIELEGLMCEICSILGMARSWSKDQSNGMTDGDIGILSLRNISRLLESIK